MVPWPEASCEYVGRIPLYGLCDNRGVHVVRPSLLFITSAPLGKWSVRKSQNYTNGLEKLNCMQGCYLPGSFDVNADMSLNADAKIECSCCSASRLELLYVLKVVFTNFRIFVCFEKTNPFYCLKVISRNKFSKKHPPASPAKGCLTVGVLNR